MNLLVIPPELPDADGIFSVDGEHAEHIFCILHAKPGDSVRTGLLGGKIGLASVLESTRRKAVLQLKSADRLPPPPSNIIPLIALPRPQSFKKTLHFIASSGIRRAVFFHSAKTEKSYWSSSAMEPQAIRSVLLEGLEQGCTTILPELTFFRTFRELFASGLLEELTRTTLPLIAHPVNAAPCPAAVDSPVSLVIGPEGGFTPEEVDQFTSASFRCITFGPHILRVEFALSYLAGRLQP